MALPLGEPMREVRVGNELPGIQDGWEAPHLRAVVLSVVPGLVVPTSPGNLLEMLSRLSVPPNELDTLGEEPSNLCFVSPPGACSRLRTAGCLEMLDGQQMMFVC